MRYGIWLLVILLCFLLSCGSRGSGPAATAPEAQQPGAFAALTAPQTLLEQLRSASAGEVYALNGADFAAGTAHNHLAAAGTTGVFSPAFDAAAPDLADCAYGIYQFNLSGLSGAQTLHLLKGDAGAQNADLWLGLGNLGTNRWDWFNGAESEAGMAFSIEDIAPYTAGDGTFLAALIVTGKAALELHSLGFTQYDEIEPNDLQAQATPIPGVGAVGLRGSLGSAVGYPGYNGSNVDIWRLNAAGGDDLNVVLTFDQATGLLEFDILDSAGVIKVTRSGSFAGYLQHSTSLTDMLAPDPVAFPLYIKVRAVSGYCDYQLSVTSGAFPVASYTVTPGEGVAPQEIQCDATASTDADGYIAIYRWSIYNTDFSVFDTFDTPGPVFEHLITEPGYYTVGLNVIDNDGLGQLTFPPSQYVVLHVPGYTEVENNDSIEAPQDLGAITSGVIVGNIGPAVPGNMDADDGDDNDTFGVTLDPEKSYRFKLKALVAPSGFDCQLTLLDSGGGFAATFSEDNIYDFTMPDSDAQYYLNVSPFSAGSDYADYELSWEAGPKILVSFDYGEPDGSTPKELTFTAHVTTDATIVKYRWQFDASKSDIVETTEPDATHTYDTPDNYTVRVEAVTDSGFAQRFSDLVTVEDN